MGHTRFMIPEGPSRPPAERATLRRVASQVIRRASDRDPADAVLRTTLLKQQGLSRDDGRRVAELLFGYYRWKGWVDPKANLDSAVEETSQLDRKFFNNPAAFTDDALRANAVPAWAASELTVTPEWLRSLQSHPRLWLRARRAKAPQLERYLGNCKASPISVCPEAVEYCGEEDLFRTEPFHSGDFEVQDLSSQIVGHVCHPEPGETWWDACAGEGGKTLHLADLMQNKGLIWASDRAEWRLKKLKQRTGRARVFNYRAVPWNGGAKLPTKTLFDGVLVDAPCTGVGTWQRNPHARWTTQPNDVRELAEIQVSLLNHAARGVKPGGRLIYSVCTVTRAETTSVAAEFEQAHPEFVPLEFDAGNIPRGPLSHQLCVWPQRFGGNGMFISCWQRKA